MTVRVAHSLESDTGAAIREVAQQFAGLDARFTLFFASPKHAPEALGVAVRDHFKGPSIGCTTAGEIAAGRMLEGAIVAMALDGDHVEWASVQDIDDVHDEASIAKAYAGLLDGAGTLHDPQRVLGLVLHDGLAVAEEQVMSTLSTLSNVPFIGGSAGDELKFERTHTFVNGRGTTGGAVLAMLCLKKRFRLVKTQSFAVTDHVLEATNVDEKDRRVRQFNGRRAVDEYARVLGVAPADLPSRFMRNPVAVLVGDDEPFVRSPLKVDGSDVVFYCRVQEGMQLRVLESRDIVLGTQRDLSAALDDFGPLSGLINFHCILRTLELKERGQMDAYGALFRDLPTIGFSTYGESYVGHINQTSTMVLLE